MDKSLPCITKGISHEISQTFTNARCNRNALILHTAMVIQKRHKCFSEARVWPGKHRNSDTSDYSGQQILARFIIITVESSFVLAQRKCAMRR